MKIEIFSLLPSIIFDFNHVIPPVKNEIAVSQDVTKTELRGEIHPSPFFWWK